MGFEEELNTAFKGAMHRANQSFWHTDMLPSGLPSLDHALGGGFGYGRIVELYGDWSSGKTMVLYYALANNQKLGGTSILFEAEGAFNAEFYAKLGGDPDTLWVYPVDTVEEVFDGMVTIVKTVGKNSKKGSDRPRVAIGWDSIAATGTKHLLEAGMEKRDMSKAGAMSAGTQLVTTQIKESRICVIATNQTREKIGSNDSATHTPGGKAWPFHSSQRVELQFDGGSKGSLIWSAEKDAVEIGRHIRGCITKNKLAAPFGRFSLPIYVKEGFWHPLGYNCGIEVGIDSRESLFYLYRDKNCTLEGREAVFTSPSSGWYELSEKIAPGYKKWQKKDWLEVLDAYPVLWTLPYEGLPSANIGSETSGEDQTSELQQPELT